jgi:general secretion pathway protein D
MTSDNTWSTRMSFVFGLCALLGILLLIFSEVGLAQTNGFRPGGAPIGNPLNDPGGDEEFDEFDDFDAPPPPRTRGKVGGRGSVADDSFTGGISVGGTPDDKSGPALNRGKKGFELSGPGTEKGIKSKNEVPTLFVDNESGSGDAADRELITDFNFPDADIMDIAKTLGRLTGKNFILDKDVKGRVSVISNSPITVADAWRAFLTSLDMNGLAIVPTGKYLRIMRQNDAKGKNVRLYSNAKAPNTDALVTKIFKIKFISAKELENVIRTYANMGARIYGFEQTNTLIITDTGSNIDKIAKMIQFLDVEGFDAGIEVISVKFASAVEIQKLIDSLLPGTQAAFPGRPGFGGGGGGARSNFAARRTKEGGLINNIIADERTNTLIVHANPKGVEQVRALISRLDRKMPQAIGGGKVHVVYLQFADAEDMAKTLKDISQSGRSAGGPGFSSGGGGGGIGINPNEGALFEGQIKISPDKTTNSLVITSSPNDFGTIQRVINKLDIPRDQIYIEVVIMEMNMNRTNDFAANILLPGGTSVAPTTDLINWIKDPSQASAGMVLRWASDSKTTVNIPTGGTTQRIEIPNLAALLKAVQTSSNGTVLATPQIMTLENTEAIFDTTDKIPIPKITNAGLGVSNVGVEFQEVPLTIKIKPQLNKISNFIKMDIKATVSDATPTGVPEALQKQALKTTKRAAETSLMVADGDTIVLGGLIRDKATEVINKVPLLGDIPILGWLFKSRSSEITKNNLMLFITPRIMRQPENVRMVLDRKLKERDEFVERAFGGNDQHREVRNNIIRNLPDVKTIKNYNPKKTVALDEEESKNDSKKDSKEGTLPEPMKEDSHETLTLPPADGGAATGPITAPPVDALPPLPDPNAGGSP